MPPLCRRQSGRWSKASDGDDPVSDRRTGVAGDRPHGYAQGLRWTGAHGPGEIGAGSTSRSSFCFSRPWGRIAQGALARWARHVPVREAPGARPLHLAVVGGWHGDDHVGAARLPVGRHRLARAATYVATTIGGGNGATDWLIEQ